MLTRVFTGARSVPGIPTVKSADEFKSYSSGFLGEVLAGGFIVLIYCLIKVKSGAPKDVYKIAVPLAHMIAHAWGSGLSHISLVGCLFNSDIISMIILTCGAIVGGLLGGFIYKKAFA